MRPSLALALALALALVVPSVARANDFPPKPEFPPEVLSLVGQWVNESRQLGANDTQRPWYPQAQGFLDNATHALQQGRARTAMLDVETYTELVLAGEIMDQAASMSSDADRRTFAIARTNAWDQQSIAAYGDYRAKLHALEGGLHSLRGLEMALYSADEALSAGLAMDGHADIVKQFVKAGGFSRDYVLALVRADHTPLLDLHWANDLLDAAGQFEGLPPRIVAANWTLIANASLQDPGYGNQTPQQLQGLEALAKDARADNESVMAVAINLAEVRADRAQQIEIIFGDAQSRGKDVLHDAAHGMNGELNNTTMAFPQGYGELGVFTADAVDRTVFTDEFLDRGQAQLSFIIAAWSGLDYQDQAVRTLAAVSPIVPPPAPAPHKTPLEPAVLLIALGVTALLLTRRR